MNKANELREYYMMGLWGISRLKTAVKFRWLTPEEFEEITHTVYKEVEK